MKVSKKIIFIVGPTAVGKTAVACLLAKKIKGEIISCDSMQVYREITIASNKPSRKTLKAVAHHLIDIVSITKDFNVASFRKKALRIIKNIHKRKRIPILVGGSGLYVNILLDGIFKETGKDEALRKRLECEAKEKGSLILYERLKKIDPRAAQKIHPHDARRIIRALEVFAINRKPISQLQKTRQGLWGEYDIKIFALNRDREKLYEFINSRVEKMFQEGAVSEIENLSAKNWSKTAEGIIGVKEIRGFLRGEYDLERAKYLMKLHSRHLAKRQLTWFRRDQRIDWIMMASNDTPRRITQIIMKKLED